MLFIKNAKSTQIFYKTNPQLTSITHKSHNAQEQKCQKAHKFVPRINKNEERTNHIENTQITNLIIKNTNVVFSMTATDIDSGSMV